MVLTKSLSTWDLVGREIGGGGGWGNDYDSNNTEGEEKKVQELAKR